MPLILQSTQLADKRAKFDHDARAYHAPNVRIEDARRHEAQLERAISSLHRVAGIASTIGAHNHGGIGGQGIGQVCPCPHRPIDRP